MRCQACGRRLTARSASAFSGYRFPDEIIALAVRWYLRFRLSYADVAEWLAERAVSRRPHGLHAQSCRPLRSRPALVNVPPAHRSHCMPASSLWMSVQRS